VTTVFSTQFERFQPRIFIGQASLEY
jgi:hypothetical protein